MASFQLDFKEDEKSVFELVDWHKNSNEKKDIVTTKSYYNKENEFIMSLPDRKYWSDRKILDKATGEIKEYSGWATNPFVSNNRIAYGIFADIVNQKVNTLLDETPEIITDYDFSPKFLKQLGYITKNAGIEASNSGNAYVFIDSNLKLTLFNSGNCIAFKDDYTGELKAFIRYIDIASSVNSLNKSLVVEVYTEQGLKIYKKTNGKIEVMQEVTPYKYTIKRSAIESSIDVKNIGLIPIVEFANNKNHTSDMTSSLKAKIDIIDLIQSGLVNNIEDFSDVFWVIKNSSGLGTSDDYEDLVANINRTKKIYGEDAQPHQFQIPTEARTKAVEMFKQEIVEESGIIDIKDLTATQLTNVAIKASTMKLRQRVSDFEWQAYKFVSDILKVFMAYTNTNFDFEINFNQLLIDNDTELINNMNTCRDDMSQIDRLRILKRVGLIEDIDETLKALEEESSYKLSDEPIYDINAVTGYETPYKES